MSYSRATHKRLASSFEDLYGTRRSWLKTPGLQDFLQRLGNPNGRKKESDRIDYIKIFTFFLERNNIWFDLKKRRSGIDHARAKLLAFMLIRFLTGSDPADRDSEVRGIFEEALGKTLGEFARDCGLTLPEPNDGAQEPKLLLERDELERSEEAGAKPVEECKTGEDDHELAVRVMDVFSMNQASEWREVLNLLNLVSVIGDAFSVLKSPVKVFIASGFDYFFNFGEDWSEESTVALSQPGCLPKSSWSSF